MNTKKADISSAKQCLLQKNIININMRYDYSTGCVYHYTSADGLKGIVSNDRNVNLWFTQYDCLNDMSERNEFIQYFEKYCNDKKDIGLFSETFYNAISKLNVSDFCYITTHNNEKIMHGNETIDGYTEMSSTDCNTYLCCFSENPDSLAMWNYYSKSKHYEGYNIGLFSHYFDKNTCFEKGYSIQLKKVIYSKQDKISLFDDLLIPLSKEYDNASVEDKRLIISAIKIFMDEYQFIFKNECFEHEKEVRAILRVPKHASNNMSGLKVEFRNSNGYLVPYVNFKLQKCIIPRITIAPILEKTIAKRTIKEFMELMGHSSTDVQVSNIPIRF